MSFPIQGINVPNYMTPPTWLSNWQCGIYRAFTDEGFNDIGVNTPYVIEKIEGLDLPPLRTTDVGRPRDTGEFIGLDLLSGRTITLTLSVAGTGGSIASAVTDLANTFIPPSDGQTEIPFWFQLPGLPLLVAMVRTRKRAIPIDLAWSQGLAQGAVIELHASDPRLYAPTASVTLMRPLNPVGLTFPVTFPVTFGPGASYASAFVNNSGNIEMRPIITITGPCTTPMVTNATTGEYLQFSIPGGSGYTLQQNESLVIDTDLHQIMYYTGGSTAGSSRRNWLVYGSTWWDIPPGGTSVQFSTLDASEPSPAPTCTVTYAPAYVSAT